METGIFDVTGPVMIGPSSSHTAGAARLGKAAGIIADGKLVEADCELSGSFARTYKGHGTDKALAAGLLGMDPGDESLKDALETAEKRGLRLRFIKKDIPDAHPNTVRFRLKTEDGRETTITGSSIGGGMIRISALDGYPISLSCETPALITFHEDKPGALSRVSSIIYENGVNIGSMVLQRSSRGRSACMCFETDSPVSRKTADEIRKLPGIGRVILFNPEETK